MLVKKFNSELEYKLEALFYTMYTFKDNILSGNTIHYGKENELPLVQNLLEKISNLETKQKRSLIKLKKKDVDIIIEYMKKDLNPELVGIENDPLLYMLSLILCLIENKHKDIISLINKDLENEINNFLRNYTITDNRVKTDEYSYPENLDIVKLVTSEHSTDEELKVKLLNGEVLVKFIKLTNTFLFGNTKKFKIKKD